MDIPNSGAIFTLGKSHLAENTQSYFYIKNDPVKRLVSGPHQSAVICESGRLFVWGENHHGQLGIGGSNSNSSSNNNNSNNNSDTNNGDTVTKPTCVKSLKTLGLKVADIAFGNDWAVMLTHSNELFFSGRNIFPDESNAARNFTASKVAQEQCTIIRKPFRLEEFDDCLSVSEEPENFVTVLAGNEHFAVMTSFGRLIGWGSNQRHQLGTGSKDDSGAPLQPHEMKLDARIQQFTCGPESTLVLTEKGGLYLTGRLNEFVFPQFTELQKNLAATEQIIFMHISKTSEIYIVTNAGSIYRSLESVRNKSLIFQRFYDYDSEENGPIWKLLKGTSFFTVLTKANKFYTTFSESGHHLKTFREISKFKNLRLLDMAVGERHILVHGIPRSSTLSATVGPGGEHRFMSRSFVMAAAAAGTGAAEVNANGRGRSLSREKILEEEGSSALDGNGNGEVGQQERKETPKPNTPIHENGDVENVAEPNANMAEVVAVEVNESIAKTKTSLEENGNEQGNTDDINKNNANKETKAKEHSTNGNKEISSDEESAEEPTNNNGRGATAILVEKPATAEKSTELHEIVPSPPGPKSPTESIQSRNSGRSNKSAKSVRSIKFEPGTVLESNSSSDKFLRPRTPYPESSDGSTPQTVKKTPLRNYSYEAAMDHDFIEHTSPALVDSLENIQESTVGESVTAPVTAIISLPTPPTEEDEQLTVEIIETTSSDANDRTIVVNEIRFINNGVDVTANLKKHEAESVDGDEEEEEEDEEEKSEGMQSIGIGDALEESTEQVREEAENLLDQLNVDIEEKVQKVDKATLEVKNEVASAVKETSETVSERVETTLHEARESMETAATRAATGARGAADAVGVNAGRLANDARHAVAAAAGGAKHAMGNAADGAKNSMENAGNAAAKAAGGARNAVESAGNSAINAVGNAAHGAKNAMGNAADGAKISMENAGNAAAKAAGGAKNAVESAGNSAINAVGNAAHGAKNAMGNAADGAKNAVENAGTSAMKAAGGAKHAVENAAHDARNAMENAGNAAAKAAGGAKNAVENAGNSTINAVEIATHGAKNAVENAGTSAMKAAGGAKNSIENALFKMADGTKYAVDTVASKISNEMHGAKENIQSMWQGKDKDKDKTKPAAEVDEEEVDEDDADVVSIKEDGDAVQTNTATSTTGGGEDDERTTASVNSNHPSSAGNPFDSGNPFESSGANPFENDDDIVERGKQALRAEIQAGERQAVETTEQSRGKVRQFFSDMRAKGKGMSCRNEKSIRIDDEPPRYSVEDVLSTSQTVAVVNPGSQQNQNGSKVCVIL